MAVKITFSAFFYILAGVFLITVISIIPVASKLSALDMQEMMNAQMRLQQKDEIFNSRKGERVDKKRKKPDGDHVGHPFDKPGILDQIKYTYRQFRAMKHHDAGRYHMGTNLPTSKTHEYPLRDVFVKSFYLDIYPVINAEFWAYRAKRKFYRTQAEKQGWSWVVDLYLSDETRDQYSMPGPNGWSAVKMAMWSAPEGVDTSLHDRWKHPVVHVSYEDAVSYCKDKGKRLPTEAEWEYAARSGHGYDDYPWGKKWERKRANTWQGYWPDENIKTDGYSLTSPVNAFPSQTLTGMYDMIGNVWEWTSSGFEERGVDRELRQKLVVLKGGSYVDSVSGKYNLPVRNGQRMGRPFDYSAGNVGFRCAMDSPNAKYESYPDLRKKNTVIFHSSDGDQPRKRKVKAHLKKPKSEL